MNTDFDPNNKFNFTRVEYDPKFFGIDYDGVGQFVLIRHDKIEDFGSLESAFEHQTGLLRCNIIHYCMDDIYDQYGDEIGRNDISNEK